MEFEKWKGAFSVDAEGTTESDTQDDGQGLLHNFVEYIKVLLFYFFVKTVMCCVQEFVDLLFDKLSASALPLMVVQCRAHA